MRHLETGQQLAELIGRLRTSLVDAIHFLDAIESLVASTDMAADRRTENGLIVDPTDRSIHFAGRYAQIKSPLRFRLFALLARRPNYFVTYHQISTEVWQGAARSRETLRSTIRLLKQDLCHLKLRELADAIVGEEQRYGLILERS